MNVIPTHYNEVTTDGNTWRDYLNLSWEQELENLIDKMNSIYALVIVSGTAKIIQRIEQQGQPVRFSYLTISALKQLYSNTKIKTGVDVIKRKKVDIYNNHATAWLNHPRRSTYPQGVQYMPYRSTPDGILNTWIDNTIEVKAVHELTTFACSNTNGNSANNKRI